MAPRVPEPSDIRLDELAARLEHAAEQLRAGDLDPGRAAARVADCARIAAEAGAELDRGVRAGDGPIGAPAPGQLALGS